MKLWTVMAKIVSVSWLNYLHLVLFLMPPPHDREQGVQEPHGPTLQSTEIKFKFKTFVILFNSLTIPGGLQATLQESVSASSIILELSFAHFSPLCLASAMISLRKKKQEFMCFRYYSFLVRFLFPNPHLTEQDVHTPHGPTSQSAEKRKSWKGTSLFFF